MKEVHPEFADDVPMYLIGADPSEGLELLERYRQEFEYPWPISIPDSGMLRDFRIISQSTKIAINSNGIITYRDGYGRGQNDWEDVFKELASQ